MRIAAGDQMKFRQNGSEIFIPDGTVEGTALNRTTHLGIGAHQDDLEFMAIDGILKGYKSDQVWFTGVVVTDGAGSPRAGKYENYSDEDLMIERIKEQKDAAKLGKYSAQVFLNHPSEHVKTSMVDVVVDDLVHLIQATRPQIIYTHNLADKHLTHVGVAVRVIEAIRRLEPVDRPEKLFGCEVWRGLDWMLDDEKVIFDTSDEQELQLELIKVFDSQVAGGKRYDLAAMGRRLANATFFASHDTDKLDGMIVGMELTPLIKNDYEDIAGYINNYLERFASDVNQTIKSILGD